jgi:antitoxin MazE
VQKYGFSDILLLEETEQGVLLRKKEEKIEDQKLSWEETYREMAAEDEDWNDFDITLLKPWN